jgi:hypothetical protein
VQGQVGSSFPQLLARPLDLFISDGAAARPDAAHPLYKVSRAAPARTILDRLAHQVSHYSAFILAFECLIEGLLSGMEKFIVAMGLTRC